jgi:hypothetical protein
MPPGEVRNVRRKLVESTRRGGSLEQKVLTDMGVISNDSPLGPSRHFDREPGLLGRIVTCSTIIVVGYHFYNFLDPCTKLCVTVALSPMIEPSAGPEMSTLYFGPPVA